MVGILILQKYTLRIKQCIIRKVYRLNPFLINAQWSWTEGVKGYFHCCTIKEIPIWVSVTSSSKFFGCTIYGNIVRNGACNNWAKLTRNFWLHCIRICVSVDLRYGQWIRLCSSWGGPRSILPCDAISQNDPTKVH